MKSKGSDTSGKTNGGGGGTESKGSETTNKTNGGGGKESKGSQMVTESK